MQEQHPSGPNLSVSAEQSRTQFRIRTFTARYDVVEDRLRLDSVDANGHMQTIFLTRRLTDKIIPIMVSHLEATTAEGVPQNLVQEMQQSGARQVRNDAGAAATVPARQEAQRWLCRTVHFRKLPTGLILTFTDNSSIDAAIQLTDANLRAVLDIFLDLYTKSGWPADVLPEWLKEEAAVNSTEGQRLN